MSLSGNMHNGDRSDIRDGEKIMKIPKLGLIICNSGASNSGHLTGLVAFEIIKKFGESESAPFLPFPQCSKTDSAY